MSLRIINGDCRNVLRDLPEKSVHCCITSPPYWGLRDYGVAGQLGLESTPQEYVRNMVQVFSYVWRVLRDDGTLWLNLGDSYARNPKKGGSGTPTDKNGRGEKYPTQKMESLRLHACENTAETIKEKNLIGIPWRVAFALQESGWYLRQDIIWAKPNPMPESVTDRCTKSHEYLFLLTKSPQYHYDAAVIREAPSPALIKQIEEGYNGHATKDFAASGVQDASGTKSRIINGYREKINKQRGHVRSHDGFNGRWDKLTKAEQMACGSNKRSVWTVATNPYKEAHFATFPPDLIKPCVLAGCPPGGTVLDCFGGSGTTGQVALELGRSAILIELNPAYCTLSSYRTNVTPGLAL